MIEVEPISRTIDSVSFVCSFGYSIKEKIPREERRNDLYILQYDDGKEFPVMRKEFFNFVARRHGYITRGETYLNACVSYDLF